GASAGNGVVPATFTVSVRVRTALFGPFTVRVYIVVLAGVICLLPLATTRPSPGSIVTPLGFSVAQLRTVDCPGWTAAGAAVKLMIRAGISAALRYADPSNPAGFAPGGSGAACCAGGAAGVCASSEPQTSAT